MVFLLTVLAVGGGPPETPIGYSSTPFSLLSQLLLADRTLAKCRRLRGATRASWRFFFPLFFRVSSPPAAMEQEREASLPGFSHG